MVVLAMAYWQGSRPRQPLNLSEGNPASATSGGETLELNEVPKDFVLRNKQGKPVKLSQFRGKPILINFWAAWCPPCVEELPSLLEFSDWAARELGLVTLAVSADPDWGSIEKLFQEKKLWPTAQIPFTILLDSSASAAGVYGVSKFPETFFVDRNFRVIRRFIGIRNWSSQEIREWVSQNSR
ncbi:MAG: TlpA disulfide reductase family protein [Bdellovibrionota bacterium]